MLRIGSWLQCGSKSRTLDHVSNGTVYRRETPGGASAWVAHIAWYEAGKRRQMKRTFRTKKDAQTSLVELLAAHQTGRFVESSKLTVRSFAESWLDGLDRKSVV